MDEQMRLGPWAAGIGAGVVVAVTTNFLNGSDKVRDQLVQVSIQLAKTNETLAAVCKQQEAQQGIDKRQDEAIQQIKLTLERNRIR
jgi:hypothetical protein